MNDIDDLNKMDVNAVTDAINHISAVLTNDHERDNLQKEDRLHLIEVLDDLSAMLARWYHIR